MVNPLPTDAARATSELFSIDCKQGEIGPCHRRQHDLCSARFGTSAPGAAPHPAAL